jgi:hypothetical protein
MVVPPVLLLLRGTTGSGKSSAADWIKTRYAQVTVIEVDDIKLVKYGTTALCNPAEDFPEAGQSVKDSIADGRATVVVEAFCEEEHLQALLTAAGLELTSAERENSVARVQPRDVSAAEGGYYFAGHDSITASAIQHTVSGAT